MSAAAIASIHRPYPGLTAAVTLGPARLVLDTMGPLARKAAGSKTVARVLMSAIALWGALGPLASTIGDLAR
ncbi:hypothetical protein [Methylobacterium brachythecii]|uniref:Uncharacterized protein n=1 Tax=Methylobacterium brachythecii TaxID=1176177 RepID=A0A7W6AGM3_9HYPH|nr:hypothetical protein [Methylobacterium brachythecii]MBB3902978.1 hypothetical protein [Methylobacterium brachythecii]GLS46321.1 hypothetical protein GCM10007884_43140 [Methylobacterium brachythecii]